MADIDVQQKERSFWPWVLGLILMAGLVWLLVEMLGGDDDPMTLDQPAAVTAPVGTETQATDPLAQAGGAALEEFVQSCSSVSETAAEMSLAHEYTADCVRLLAGAVASVVERDTVGRTALDPALDEFRQTAAELQETPETSPNHSSMLRDVAISASELMAQVQESRQAPAQSGEEVTQSRTAAEAIQSEVPLMDQQGETGAFFREAGEALRALSQ
jgi:hypothetical protein